MYFNRFLIKQDFCVKVLLGLGQERCESEKPCFCVYTWFCSLFFPFRYLKIPYYVIVIELDLRVDNVRCC